MFKKKLLKFNRPEPNFTHNIHDTKGLKLPTRLPLGLSRLVDHKFRHNFQDCASPIPHCPNHHYEENPLSQDKSRHGNIPRQSDSTVTKILLYGGNKLDFEANKVLLMSKIEFNLLTERFSCPLIE